MRMSYLKVVNNWIKLDQKGSNWFKVGLNWIILVQNRPKRIKSWICLDQERSSGIKLDQKGSKVGPNWIKRYQKGSNSIKQDQIESNRIKLDQTRSKLIILDQKGSGITMHPK